MNIKIVKCSDHYHADCLDLPGSPPTGVGKTKEMALACLFWNITFGTTQGGSDRCWSSFLRKEDPIEVNGKPWAWPDSYKNQS